MRVKICGITKPEQGQAIAQMGATALGFICVPASPRYVTPNQIGLIVDSLTISVDTVGVFANASVKEICATVVPGRLSAIQLHGNESPEFCTQLRQFLPEIEMIKALRVKTPDDLHLAYRYVNYVDTLLLDAYHPQMLGGTGKTLDWETLAEFHPPLPWFLAGGLTPENILEALKRLHPNGIDVSSGVERSPGDKDLDKVALLFQQIL
ncbi:MAG: phosphoribosylanthranilate isomerase [Coleofasciculus sp. G1-WW12-02]|uniref:phosphoribosylanthranilate isomerase n=1 Tax=Coleofasciculus sp. G1-WW12-02 TaxID=3068483 RepID=UPI0032F46C3C